MDLTEIVKKRNRNYWMGWSICLIILCHIQYTCYNGKDIMNCMRFLFKKGECGVDVFIFLSIVGLSYSIERNSIWSYYRHRIKRIFPMYLLFLFLSYVLFTPKDNLFRIFFLQLSGMANFTGNTFNEWFIPALLLIYASFPLFFYGITRLYRANQFLCVLLIIIVIYSYIITSDFITLFFARRLYLIILGIVVYLTFKQKSKLEAIGILSIIAMLQLFIPSDFNMYLYVPLLLVILDSLFNDYPMYRIMNWLGKHSLEVYLGQTMGIIFYCNQSSLRPLYKLPIGIIITFVSAIILLGGHLCLQKLTLDVIKYIEKEFLKLGKKNY